MDERKALIGSIQKFSTEDGPGVRTTVFFKGCPLACVWCHNPEMIDTKQQIIISPGKCIRCKECEKACPNEGIQVTESGPEIVWGKCEGCCRNFQPGTDHKHFRSDLRNSFLRQWFYYLRGRLCCYEFSCNLRRQQSRCDHVRRRGV